MALAAQVLRINTACLRMGVSRSTLNRLVKSGAIKTIKLSSRAVGILEADLVAYLERI
jgi:excisionase family DNA binding protein